MDDDDDDEQERLAENEDEGSLGWAFVGEIDEEEHIDIGDTGESVDVYWAKGWLSEFRSFRRFNTDGYGNRTYKVFPTRYRLKDLKLSKSLRRLLKKNQSLNTFIRPLRITEAKERLYSLYQEKRHDNPNTKSLAKTYDYIKYHQSDLMELCIFDDQKLIACSIFQVGTNAICSDLAFWDLDKMQYGLGIMTVLLEMQYGQSLNLRYYYLGHYFRKHPNYQYKTRFSGLELYDWDNNRWIDYKDEAIEALLSQKLVRDRDYEV